MVEVNAMGQNADGTERTKDNMQPPPEKLSNYSVCENFKNGLWVVKYDGQGLQQASVTTSNPESTWYNFIISNKAGDVVGNYHIHPSGIRFFSGNLRILTNNSFGNYIVGQARDWIFLCNAVKNQIK